MLFCEQASAGMQTARAALPGFSKYPLQQGIDRWGFPLSQPHPGYQGLHQSQQPQHQQQQHLQHQEGQCGQHRQSNNQQTAEHFPFENHQQQQSLQQLHLGQNDARSAELNYIGAVDWQLRRSPATLAPEASQDRRPQTQRLFQQNDRTPAAATSIAVAAAAAVTSQGAFTSAAAPQPVRSSAHLPHPLLGQYKFLTLRTHVCAIYICFGLDRMSRQAPHMPAAHHVAFCASGRWLRASSKQPDTACWRARFA